MNDPLAAELATMASQEARAMAHSMRFGSPIGGHEDLHAKRMEAILQNYGWPTPALVGEKGCRDALTIVEHSKDKDLHALAFEKLKKAAHDDKNPVLEECLRKLTMKLGR